MRHYQLSTKPYNLHSVLVSQDSSSEATNLSSRNVVLAAKILHKVLGAFQSSGLRRRSEREDTGVNKVVGETSNEGNFGTNDH